VLKRIQTATVFPYLSLLAFFLPLLLLSSGQQSLTPHDEGYYAMQARWIWQNQDWVTMQWWGDLVCDRTIGIQWLIALCYGLFGIHETSARLPSLIAAVISLLLTYRLGAMLVNPRVAWLGSAILAVTALWVQYARMAGQDSVLVCLELVGIVALLQAEIQPQQKFYWGLLAGSTFGLGFLIKGFMIALPGVAILPYLMAQHRRHQHLLNPGLYGGLVLGAIPVLGWFWANWQRYGSEPFQQLFGKLVYLGTSDTYNPGPFYYLWNIPANAFPWPLFCLLGYGLVWAKTSKPNHRHCLLLSYPLILFLLLSIFKTRTPYYPLQLMPFMAIFAAIGLEWLSRWTSPRKAFLVKLLSYGFAALGLGLLLAATMVHFSWLGIQLDPADRVYAYLVMPLGLSWLGLGIVCFWGHSRQQGRDVASPLLSSPSLPQKWLATWLLGPWLSLALAGSIGLLGDRSPYIHVALAQPDIHQTLQANPVNFVTQAEMDGAEHKTWILLSFYTPQLGDRFSNVEDLPPSAYAWLSPKIESGPKTRLIGTLREWQLVQKLE
jgi:4-amino-4-deoxy-L-arabinose transferase-like glycosyltransferase